MRKSDEVVLGGLLLVFVLLVAFTLFWFSFMVSKTNEAVAERVRLSRTEARIDSSVVASIQSDMIVAVEGGNGSQTSVIHLQSGRSLVIRSSKHNHTIYLRSE